MSTDTEQADTKEVEQETLPTPEETKEESEEVSQEEQTARLKWLEEKTGYSLSDRYSSDEALAEGIKNAFELIGQRDEDAAFGRALRQTLKPEQVDRLLKGEPEPNGNSTPEPEVDADLPKSYREYALLLEKLKQSSDTADPEYRKALAAARAFSERNFEAVQEVDNLKSELAQVKEAISKQQAAFQYQTEEQRINEWLASHAQEFWQNPDSRTKPTALAEQVAHQFENNPICRKLPSESVDRWEAARMAAKLAMQPMKKTEQASNAAINRPGARGKAKAVTLDGLLKQGLSDEKALEILSEYYLSQETG